MMGIGFPELMIILVIIMIIFGAGKLPQIGSAFGRSIKNFKTSMKEASEEEMPVESEIKSEMSEEVKAVPENAESAHGDGSEASEDKKGSANPVSQTADDK